MRLNEALRWVSKTCVVKTFCYRIRWLLSCKSIVFRTWTRAYIFFQNSRKRRGIVMPSIEIDTRAIGSHRQWRRPEREHTQHWWGARATFQVEPGRGGGEGAHGAAPRFVASDIALDGVMICTTWCLSFLCAQASFETGKGTCSYYEISMSNTCCGLRGYFLTFLLFVNRSKGTCWEND